MCWSVNTEEKKAGATNSVIVEKQEWFEGNPCKQQECI